MTPEEAELIKEGMKITNGWLEKAFGPAIEQAGGMLGDWLEDKRNVLQYNRQVVAHKVKTIMIEENVTTKEISSKVLFPLLEGISLEDDETLQDMWANLIVNYIDSEQTLCITVYPGILKQLSSQEVNILQQLSEENGEAVSFELFMQRTSDGDAVMRNLERLSLVEEVPQTVRVRDYTRDAESTMEKIIENSGMYSLTIFGIHFLEACKR